MTQGRRHRLSFPAQLLTTALIVVVLAGVARLTSSEEDARAFDEAAEQTRFQLEQAAGAGEAAELERGIGGEPMVRSDIMRRSS